MQHPDDGLIEEYLDGELAPPARADLEAHLAGCEACRERFDAARRYFAEATNLIEQLGEPIPAVPLPPTAIAPLPARPPARLPVRQVAWAATLVLAAGLGYASGTWRAQSEGADLEVASPAAAPAPSSPPAQELSAQGQAKAEELPTSLPATKPSGREAERRDQAAAGPPSRRPAVQPSEPAAGGRAANALDQLRDEDRLLREAEEAKEVSSLAKSAAEPSSRRAAERASLDDAVRVLGGSIRLIDGMEVEMVQIEQPVVGEPAVVVLTYRDAAGNPVVLRQRRAEPLARQRASEDAQRLAAADRANRAEAPAPAAVGALANENVGKDKYEEGALTWTDAAGFRLVLRADADPDSLRKLRALIR